MTVTPAYPTTKEGVIRILRGRVTWKYAPEEMQRRFVSLYLRHDDTPDRDVLTAWIWYYRGSAWEGAFSVEKTAKQET